MPATRRVSASLASTLVVVGLLLAACGDDDASSAATTASDDADLTAYCEAALAWDTAPDPDDFEDEDSIAEHFETVLLPRFDALEVNATADVEDDLTIVRAALDGEGDEAEAEQAVVRIHRFSAERCGWSTHTVLALDYAFEGAPDTVASGIVSFDVANDGDEAHMLGIIRRNDGVSTPFAELAQLPVDDIEAMVELSEPAAFLEPGHEGFAVAELEPGEYALICFVPVGTTNLFEIDHDQSDGPSHAAEGMVHEFTVE
jgi:hypothetical protein